VQPVVLNSTVAEGEVSLLSSGVNSDSGIGKLNLSFLELVSSVPVNTSCWKKDLGKGNVPRETISRGMLGVEDVSDCVTLSKIPSGEAVRYDSLDGPIGFRRKGVVDGSCFTLDGRFTLKPEVSLT
jgi:hypothetical protein